MKDEVRQKDFNKDEEMDEKLSEEDITFVLKNVKALDGAITRLEECVQILKTEGTSVKYKDVRELVRGMEEAYRISRRRYNKHSSDSSYISQCDERFSKAFEYLTILKLREEQA